MKAVRRIATSAVLLSVAIAGCSGASGPPSVVYTPPPTAAPSPSGPTAYTSTTFDEPFTITLPQGWLVGDEQPNMTAFYLPMGPNQGPSQAIDIQEVSKVVKDPCDDTSAEIDPGSSPADLATWMGTWAPLHAGKPGTATISGLAAITVDEGFAGTPCDTANLWRTDGGYLDPAEHKRYSILDVGGKRLVVTLVGRDDTWDTTSPDTEKVLETLTFTDRSAEPVVIPDALVGTWVADVKDTTATSGSWQLKADAGNLSLKNPRGSEFFTLDPTAVTDHEVTFPAAADCPDQTSVTEGRYTYTIEGASLRFSLISDSCGDRSGTLTASAWTRQP